MEIVPRFFLYGEAGDEADSRFLHIETIPARSLPHGWHIAPHRHPGLLQLLLAEQGGGRAQFDGQERDFAAPALLLLPPAVIHGFTFQPGTDGWVLSLALPWAAELLAEDTLPEAALLLPLEPAALVAHRVPQRFAELAEEFAAHRPGRSAALAAQLRLLLIALARLRAGQPRADAAASADTLHFARFRALVEQWFHEPRPIADYQKALGLSEKRLAALCRAAAGRTPLQILNERRITEARRSLRYSSLSVAEIGYGLGFRDPAYFSRFFRRMTGLTPGQARDG
ncbi:helix-turn-helix domain-containing protein [Teichococcus aestuarii]|uniref:helix-turn-helix domain-containing protein n=1 Tax=Teichococcus aestuarii TaxID=568898 RepID=UPI003608A6FE